jgi:predicted esterase
MCHGSADSVVLEKWGQQSYQYLQDIGITGRYVVYPGMEHEMSNAELRDVIEFIERKLPPPVESKL